MHMTNSTVEIKDGKVLFSKEILEYFENLRNKETSEWIDKYFEVLSDTLNFDAEKYNIRAGMGLDAVQLGVLKRFFVVSYKNDDGTFEEYKVINPKVLSHSEELIYVEEGEGCLSVNRPIDGIVPRYARITVEYYDEFGQKHEKRIREEIAVAFQHEIDHLNGILFVDKIDKKDPFKNQDNMRAI